MALINSALGPIDTSSLGFTLSHEHVVVTSAGIPLSYPDLYRRTEAINRAVRDLQDARREGVRTIIDMTTLDLGRDMRLIEEASRRSGVQIVVTTGIWTEIPVRAFERFDPDQLAALFVREIESGIDGTGIKAGVIKAANNNYELSPLEVTVLRAVARAHKATGVPVSTHTRARNRVGEPQLAILEEEGVDPAHICIGHSGDTADVEYLLGLLRRGVYLGLDGFPGSERRPPVWEERTAVLKRLLDAGYADRLMLSHDWELTTDWYLPQTLADREAYNPDRYLFVTRRVLPRLRQMGVPQGTIQRMTVDNPRRFFEGG